MKNQDMNEQSYDARTNVPYCIGDVSLNEEDNSSENSCTRTVSLPVVSHLGISFSKFLKVIKPCVVPSMVQI
jgi:hypothetical protein